MHEQKFIAEGVKIISELLNSEFQVAVIYCTEKYLPQLAPLIIKKNIPLELITESELHSISQLENNLAALALVYIPAKSKPEIQDSETVLILEGINDPGNLGTMIRTADWFGITKIFCSENTVDLYNSKVISATMGSLAHVKVYYENLPTLLSTVPFKQVYGTFLNGKSLKDIPKTKTGPIALIMGSESHGISPQLEKFITEKITIQGKGKAESLNVALSCGIVLYELLG